MSIEKEYKFLKKWEHPSSYMGYSPVADYVVTARHRESELLTQSNYSFIIRKLKALVAAMPEGEREPRVMEADEYEALGYSKEEAITREHWVYTWSARCSMVGWIEYLMLHGDAPQVLKDAAEEMLKSLDGYPVLDEDDYSMRVDDAVWDYWKDLSEEDQIELCEECGAEFIDCDDMPAEVNEHLVECGMFF